MEYGSFEKNGVTVPTADVRVLEMVMLGPPGPRAVTADDVEDATIAA
jgi:hypothetical protein